MRIPLLHAAFAAAVFALPASCRSYEVVSPATLVASPKAAQVRAGEKAFKLDLTPIRHAIANSTWSSEEWIDKGSYHLELQDAPDIHVSIYGAFFRVEGQRGCYQVRDREKEVFQKFFRELREKDRIPWQINHG